MSWHSYDVEHPRFTRDGWSEDTRSGSFVGTYPEWVAKRLEDEARKVRETLGEQLRFHQLTRDLVDHVLLNRSVRSTT